MAACKWTYPRATNDLWCGICTNSGRQFEFDVSSSYHLMGNAPAEHPAISVGKMRSVGSILFFRVNFCWWQFFQEWSCPVQSPAHHAFQPGKCLGQLSWHQYSNNRLQQWVNSYCSAIIAVSPSIQVGSCSSHGNLKAYFNSGSYGGPGLTILANMQAYYWI